MDMTNEEIDGFLLEKLKAANKQLESLGWIVNDKEACGYSYMSNRYCSVSADGRGGQCGKKSDARYTIDEFLSLQAHAVKLRRTTDSLRNRIVYLEERLRGKSILGFVSGFMARLANHKKSQL